MKGRGGKGGRGIKGDLDLVFFGTFWVVTA